MKTQPYRLETVYIIGPEDGPFKVGITDDVVARLYDLQVSHWQQLVVHGEFVVKTRQEARDVERRAHQALKPSRLRGEWFGASLEEVTAAVAGAMPAPSVTDPRAVVELHPLNRIGRKQRHI